MATSKMTTLPHAAPPSSLSFRSLGVATRSLRKERKVNSAKFSTQSTNTPLAGALLFLGSLVFAAAQTSDIKRNHVGTIRSVDAAQHIVIFEFSERVGDRAVMSVTDKTRIVAVSPTRKRRKLTFDELKPGMRAEFVGIASSRHAWGAESIKVLEK